MLLPDNMNPELSIYYNGSIIVEVLQKNNSQTLVDLYLCVKKRVEISFPTYMLGLDWLYLIDMVFLDNEGVVSLCTSKS